MNKIIGLAAAGISLFALSACGAEKSDEEIVNEEVSVIETKKGSLQKPIQLNEKVTFSENINENVFHIGILFMESGKIKFEDLPPNMESKISRDKQIHRIKLQIQVNNTNKELEINPNIDFNIVDAQGIDLEKNIYSEKEYYKVKRGNKETIVLYFEVKKGQKLSLRYNKTLGNQLFLEI